MRAALATVIERRQVGGTELRGETRTALEGAFGVDLGAVRIHADMAAGRLSRALGAQAFTAGQHIFFGPGAYSPASAAGRRLLTHELAHVVQPGGAGSGRLTLTKADDPAEREADQVGESVAKALEAGPAAGAVPPPPLVAQPPRASGAALTVQRRLIATGDIRDIVDFISLVEPPIGLTLVHDPVTQEITAIGPGTKPATSLELRTILTTVMNDPVRNAEVNIGKGQPEVSVGAFPTPEDLSGGKVQAIDIDDVLNIEAGAKGSGLAKIGHEIAENYHAHGLPVVAGTSRFPESHRVGVAVEDRIAREIVGPGRRVASVLVDMGGSISMMVEDQETYFLVFTLTRNVATRSVDVSKARRASRVRVSTRRIDGFDIGSPAVPAAGAPTIAAVAADVANNQTATVRIEAFTDAQPIPTRSPVASAARARQWAEGTRDAILAAGAGGDKEGFNLIALGAMSFVAPNDTEANRARNRRVVITVERPGP
jgi:flagellar motor protein MotB